MTGNGNHTTYKNGDDCVMISVCFTHIIKKERKTERKKESKKARKKEELSSLPIFEFQKPYHILRYPLPEDSTRPVLTYCG
jgi:hypothetical protein